MITGSMSYSRWVASKNTNSLDLTVRNENVSLSNALLIPGLDRLNPNKLFANGQPGGWPDPYDLTRMWVDDAGTTPATIASLGTGIGRVITKGNAITLTQANAADRPVWGRHPVSGIRNLLNHTESLQNAAWQKTQQGTGVLPVVTDNFEISPYGPATRIQFNLGGGTTSNDRSSVIQGFNPPFTPHNSQFYFRPLDATATSVFTTTNFGIIAGGTGSRSVTDMGNGWFRFSQTITPSAISGTMRFEATGNNAPNTIDVLIAAPQAEAGSTATTYQRVTNRFDITEVNSPSLYYFSTNGVNQGWVSNANVDFSGTNKVTIWAGVAKLSDAAFAALVELSADSNVNNGTFLLAYPRSSLESGPNMVMKGTGTLQSTLTTGPFPAPRTSAICGTASISPPLVAIRENGTLLFSNSTTTGSGNFSSNLLYLFRRGGVSGPFNGRIYSLIIAGDNYDTRTIQQFSDWSLKPRRLIVA